MTMTFTDEQVTASIEKVVREKGRDFVYRSPDGLCVNAMRRPIDAKAVPSCLIGHVFFDLGVPVEDLLHCYASIATQLVDMLKIEVSPHVARALRSAQIAQDSGSTWGYALDVYHLETSMELVA